MLIELWGEHEQAALNCYIAKVLPVKYQNTAHWLWHVAKRGLSSLCCLQKCLNFNIKETVTIAENGLT